MSQVHNLPLEVLQPSLENNDSLPDEANKNINISDTNNVRHRELSRNVGRILWIMKLIGAYYGDISPDEDLQVNPSFLSRFYCVFVLLGQWFLVVQCITSLFYEGLEQMSTFYLLLIGSIWYLQNASVTTVSLFILPKRKKTHHPFIRFLKHMLSTATDSNGITARRESILLASTCFMSAANAVCLVLLDVYQHVSVAMFRPWNGSLAYRVIGVLFGVFDSFAWTVPLNLFFVSCAVLEGMFDNLRKKIPRESPHSHDIASLRQEHKKLCEKVAMADKVFSPFLLVVISLDIPLVCINFHQLVKSPSNKENITVLISVTLWCMTVTAKLALILIFGVKLNEKVRVQRFAKCPTFISISLPLQLEISQIRSHLHRRRMILTQETS